MLLKQTRAICRNDKSTFAAVCCPWGSFALGNAEQYTYTSTGAARQQNSLSIHPCLKLDYH